MDEATASIDYSTDAKIQETLREIKGSTIITIAHRLKTIVDYDKVLVLDKGEVVEYGSPWELIERDFGSFRGLCESSGEFDVLLDAARRAKTSQSRSFTYAESDQASEVAFRSEAVVNPNTEPNSDVRFDDSPSPALFG